MSFDVCLTFDDNYAPHTAAVMASVLDKLPDNRRARFHLLCLGVSAASKSRLEKLRSVKDCDLRFIDVSDAVFNGFPRYKNSLATFIKLGLGEFLPDLKKVLFLECDIIVNTGVDPLFEIDLGDTFAAAVPVHKTSDLPFFSEKYPHFGLGAMLVNLDELRKKKILDKAVAVARGRLARDEHAVFASDSLFFEAYEGNVTRLPYAWHVVATPHCRNRLQERWQVIYKAGHSLREILAAEKSPKIIHYGAPKPWQYDVPFQRHYWHDFYWKYQRVTPFYEEVLRSYREEEQKFAGFVEEVPEEAGALKRARERCLNFRDPESIFSSLPPEKRLVFFGAGFAVRQALEYVAMYQNRSGPHYHPIDCIIDNDPNKIGTFLNGVPVRSFADLLEMAPDVGIVLTNTHVAAILDQLHAHGLADSVRGSFFLDLEYFGRPW